MGETAKLTKKQKKALAFRERKGKGRAKGSDAFDEDNAVPVSEDQDVSEEPVVEDEQVNEPEGGVVAAAVQSKGKKRKRGLEDHPGDRPEKAKRQHKGDGEAVSVGVGDTAEDGTDKDETAKDAGKEGVKRRFILFVGTSWMRICVFWDIS